MNKKIKKTPENISRNEILGHYLKIYYYMGYLMGKKIKSDKFKKEQF